MGCPSEVVIGDNLTFGVCTHDPDTGELTDADAVPSYRVYEDETAVPILTGDMAKLDDADTTGFYTETLECTAGNGFENGKTYTIYIEAMVDGATGGITYSFKAVTDDWADGARLDLILDAIAASATLNTLVISPVGGTTDGNGNVGGTTVVDSTRAEDTNHWNNLAIEITSGDLLGQSRTIKTYTSGVGFTVSRPFAAQVPSGVTYRVISATVYQPGIAIVKNYPATVEPTTLSYMGIAVITNEGSPSDGDLTAGTITIQRIRDGAATAIVSDAACSLLTGNIYYGYTFPAASWQPGDMYRAQMSGQEVSVNGIAYPLAIISMEGRISREATISAHTGKIEQAFEET